MTRAHGPGEGRGWIEFVGLFFIVAGAFNAIAGVTALSRPDVFHEDAALIQNMSFWAWVWLPSPLGRSSSAQSRACRR